MSDLFLRSPTPGELTLRDPLSPDPGGGPITPIIARDYAGGSTTSGSFGSAVLSTAALDNGVTYLVIVQATHGTDGAFPSTSGSEMEARFGTTRYALSGAYNYFADFNSGDVANGGVLAAAFTVVGDGSSTINLRVRVNGGTDTARWGGAVLIAIPLTLLTLGTDYWVAEAPNSDTAEVTCAGTAFQTGDSDGILTFTPASTGDYTLIFSAESFLNGTPDPGGEQHRARARMDDGTAQTICTETEFTKDTDGGFVAQSSPSFLLYDHRTLTGGVAHTFQWEFANSTPGDSMGYRRTRVFAFRDAAFRNVAAIVDGGNVVANGGDADAANSLDWDFGSSVGTLVLASCSHQNGFAFGDASLFDGATEYPTSGIFPSIVNVGTTTSNDQAWVSISECLTLSGAQSWLLRGHSDSANDLTFGRNYGNTAPARTPLIAIDLYVPGAASPATGTAAMTSPVPTLASSGEQTQTGSAAIASTVPTLAAAGTQTQTGTAAMTAPVPTLAASGAQTQTGAAALTSPVPTLAAAGDQTHAGTAATSAPVPTLAASGSQTHEGSASTTTPTPTLAASGSQDSAADGSAALTSPSPVLAAAGEQTHTGSAATTTPAPTLAAAGAQGTAGAAATTTPPPVVAASGAQAQTGTAAVSSVAPTLAAAGAQTQTGTAATTAPVPTLAALGGQGTTGSAAISATAPTLAASGSQTHAGAAATSSVVPTIAAAGTAIGGSAAISSPAPTIAAAGAHAQSGSAAIAAIIPALAAAGAQTQAGAAALSSPTPSLAADGTSVLAGAAAVTAPAAALAAAGAVAQSGAAEITAPAPTIAAAGNTTSDISGAATISVLLPEMLAVGIGGRVSSLPIENSGADDHGAYTTQVSADPGAYTISGPSFDPLSLPLENS